MGSETRDYGGMERHPEGLMFDQVSRRLQLYLTAMWGRVFPIRALEKGEAQIHQQATILGETLHFPRRLAGAHGITPLACYRAAAMHMAAHVAYSPKFDVKGLKPRQRLLVELVEDARIEALAIKAFPGMGPLWSSLMPVEASSTALFPDLIRRLSRAFIAPESVRHDDFWVSKGVKLFLERQDKLEDPEISLEIGLRLAHDLGQMRLPMNDNEPILLAIYRDDNRHLWQLTESVEGPEMALSDSTQWATIPGTILKEADEGVSFPFTERFVADHLDGRKGMWVEDSGQPAQLIYFRNPQNNERMHTVSYPEWFESLGVERSSWCTVREEPAPVSNSEIPARILAQHGQWLKRQRRAMGSRRMRRLMRSELKEDGDDLDIDAVVHALVERRARDAPDPRIYQSRRVKPNPGMCISLLLDLSESVNTPRGAEHHSLLDLARQIILLMGETIKALDFPLAVGGFRSNGRHEVDYVRVKTFDEGFDKEAHARLYGLKGGGSTRMGAAIRHACAALAEKVGEHRHLFIMTDGEPSDIDVFDANHLIQDARDAVRQARQRGIHVFCVCLDAQAQPCVERIFGAAHYTVLDKMDSLTQRLTQLFRKLDQPA